MVRIEDFLASSPVRTEDGLEVEVVFPSTAEFFKGHFDGSPVLPGVVQLGVAHHFAEQLLGRRFAPRMVKKMKFVRPIVPDERVKLKLAATTGGSISYTFYKGNRTCSSGIFLF